MLRRRRSDSFNLAFLDVMSCGLGAVLLIFMLIKFNAETSIPSDEIERLQGELEALQEQERRASADFTAKQATVQQQERAIASLQGEIEELTEQAEDSAQALEEGQIQIADLEKSVMGAAPPEQAPDPVRLSGTTEETYLIGLRVEGRRIGILLDHSASMAAETLRDIIALTVAPAAEKQAGAKWQRTKRVARWLLARLPANAEVTVVAFNDDARVVAAANRSARNDRALQQLAAEIDGLVPENGTDLNKALSRMRAAMPDLTDLYVITDGLPTLGVEDFIGLRNSSVCSEAVGRARRISGECRLRLFGQSVRQLSRGNVTVNVVLLPLEGDPFAAQAYWDWTRSSGGTMISPAATWP